MLWFYNIITHNIVFVNVFCKKIRTETQGTLPCSGNIIVIRAKRNKSEFCARI